MDLSTEIKRVSETYGIPMEELDEEWVRRLSISVDVRKASEAYDIPIERLDQERAEQLKENCIRKYVKNKNIRFYWEGIVDASLISDPNGWELVPDFVQDKSCLMFFEDHDDWDMFVIRNGKDLGILLNNTYNYEFYITDFETSYLICFNHHDILYGCGAAKPWVDSLKRSREEEKKRKEEERLETFLVMRYILRYCYKKCKEKHLGCFLNSISTEPWADGKYMFEDIYEDWEKQIKGQDINDDNIIDETIKFMSYYEETWWFHFPETKKILHGLKNDKQLCESLINEGRKKVRE